MSTMRLITSTWGKTKTFKLIPVDSSCPYNEAIFDLDAKVLAIIGKERKQTLHMLTKLDDKGDLVRMKIGKRENGKDYAEERKVLETFYEYYIEDIDEIKAFLKDVAVNFKEFDYKQFTDATPAANLDQAASLIQTV